MAQTRELRRRIRSVENTRQITRTRELVATSKLKRATDRVYAARPYAEALDEIVGGLYSPGLSEKYPILRRPDEVKRAAILLLTANRGEGSDQRVTIPLLQNILCLAVGADTGAESASGSRRDVEQRLNQVTLSVTVSPSFQRKTGAGTDPLIAVANRSLPVKLTGVGL